MARKPNCDKAQGDALENYRNQSSYEQAKYRLLDSALDLVRSQDLEADLSSLDPAHPDPNTATHQINFDQNQFS